MLDQASQVIVPEESELEDPTPRSDLRPTPRSELCDAVGDAEADVAQWVKNLKAEERRLKEEGRRLRLELRRARPTASIAGTLHQELFGGVTASSCPSGTAGAAAEGEATLEAADLKPRLEQHQAVESRLKSEVAALKDRMRLQEELEQEAARLISALRPGASERPAALAGLAPTTREVRLTREIVELRQWLALLERQASEFRALAGSSHGRSHGPTVAAVASSARPGPGTSSDSHASGIATGTENVPDFALSPAKGGTLATVPDFALSPEEGKMVTALGESRPMSPAAPPSTPRPGMDHRSQRQEFRRLQQLDFVTRRLHEVLRSRGAGVSETAASSPAVPPPQSTAPSSVSGTSLSVKSELLEQQLQAFYERFLLRRRFS